MRSFARGSDGLAEICVEDAKKVVIPLLDDEARVEMNDHILNLKKGKSTLNSVIKGMIKSGEIDYKEPQKRPSHIVLV